MIARRRRTLLVGAALVVAACEPGPQVHELRLSSETLQFIITADPSPPFAREQTQYRVIIRDRETRQPIEGGQGQIYATSHDRANVYHPLSAGEELGSYYGRLNYVTAGEWAVAIRFRRDSLSRLEKVDWYQEVRAARDEPVSEPGSP